jgi:hypothetical protein
VWHVIENLFAGFDLPVPIGTQGVVDLQEGL